MAMYPIRVQFLSMTLGVTSAPIFAVITSSVDLTYHWLMSSKCMATRSFMVNTPRKSVSGRAQFLRHGVLLPRPIFWKAVPTPQTSQMHLPVPRPPLVLLALNLLIFPPVGEKLSPLAFLSRTPKALKITARVSV